MPSSAVRRVVSATRGVSLRRILGGVQSTSSTFLARLTPGGGPVVAARGGSAHRPHSLVHSPAAAAIVSSSCSPFACGGARAPTRHHRRYFTSDGAKLASSSSRRGDETLSAAAADADVIDGSDSDSDSGDNGERIVDLELHQEASQSYLAYAMSVIVGRALPDVRDGLKPVHRRILFAMHELGLDSKKPFKKCARVVGEVLGKFHPHGDQSVYDALVRMAQDFSMSTTLVDGHGNFGSLDADPPAAMRYTECRLRAASEAMLLADITADAVDFTETFDGSQTEPAVLPARLPNILINGSTGIAVGMATSIPPHNLKEVADALCVYAEDPEGCTLDDLLAVMPGPDFPTGGIIDAPAGVGRGPSGFREVYKTGRGSVTLRGAATIEKIKNGGSSGSSSSKAATRDAVVITSIPYQTNKASLCEQIADLVNAKQIEGVADVRDESDRDGMRVVVELRRTADPNFVLEQLYRRTKLQVRVSVNLVGLVGREPKVLTLMDIMQEFLEFRCESVERRARHELAKASSRLHVVEGYLAVQAAPDAVVAAIRAAKDGQSAQLSLQEKPFWLSEKQSEAVLAMPLRRLTGMERDKLKAEEAELTSKVTDLEGLLADRSRVIRTVVGEAKELRDVYGVERRTLIDTSAADARGGGGGGGNHLSGDDGAGGGKPMAEMDESERAMAAARLHAKRHNITLERLNADSLVIMTGRGYIKRIDPDVFSKQNKNTRGRNMGKMRGGDEVTKVAHCRGLDTVLFFTDRGRVYAVRAYDIPHSSTNALGTPFTRVLQLREGEAITAMLPVDTTQKRGVPGEAHLVMVTARGVIKKTCASEFVSIQKNGKKALTLRRGDRLKHVDVVREGDGIIIGAGDGNVIHFAADSIRAQGRTAAGVAAMKFKTTKEEEAAEAAAATTTTTDNDDNDEDDAAEALPANVAGMAIVPASVVKSLGLDVPAGAASSSAASDDVMHTSPSSDDEKEISDDDDDDVYDTNDGGPWMLLLSSQGKGKRIALDNFKQQRRGGNGKKGLGLYKGDRLAALCLTGMTQQQLQQQTPTQQSGDNQCETGDTVPATEQMMTTTTVGSCSEHVIIGSQEGVMNRFDVESIQVQKGRATKGVGVMKLKDGDSIRDITLLPAEDVALLPSN